MHMIVFERAGVCTTIQDYGRFGQQDWGVSVSGAMDKRLMEKANYALDNKNDAPVIEFCLVGPKMNINGTVQLSVSGDVEFYIYKNGRKLIGEPHKAYTLHDGDTIDCVRVIGHTYAYIGIKNVLVESPVLGSYSIDTRTNIGTNGGRMYRDGDTLLLNDITIEHIIEIEQVHIPHFKEIKIHKGPQWDIFENPDEILSKPFKVSNKRNRVGMWLEGEKIIRKDHSEILSEGIIKGAVQVTPDGDCIVLLNDHGTTGGYPKIAVVDDNDCAKIAQAPTNEEVTFFME